MLKIAYSREEKKRTVKIKSYEVLRRRQYSENVFDYFPFTQNLLDQTKFVCTLIWFSMKGK